MKVEALDKVKRWHVIYTKSKWEKKVEGLLLKSGIESWCPVQKKERQWSDRKKIIEEPLFRSYVFVKIEKEEHSKVLGTIGVVNFLYFEKKPAIIRDNEIETIVVQRRSLRAVVDLSKSQMIKAGDFVALRPCPVDALSPIEIKAIVGRTLRRDIPAGDYLQAADLQ